MCEEKKQEEMKVESCCPNCRPDLYVPRPAYPYWPPYVPYWPIWYDPTYYPMYPNYYWKCETTANSGSQ